MSYGHLATMFPVGSPGLPTPPASQVTGSPSPPSSVPINKNLTDNTNNNNNNNPQQANGQQPQQPGHCCENGRPMMTDPHTGQTVCSCQYGSALLSSYSRLPSLTSNLFGTSGSYGTAAGSQPPYMPLGTEGSAFYSPLGANGSNIRDSGADAWRSLTQPSIYDTPAMGFYPYGPSYGGLDLNARRKNATRESTNTLKAWLQEHIKNPYPTKGEKIMLAIITKMTLTQVSTWFANARRRLKKENKMTWSPRNRSEDGDDEDDDENDCDNDRKNDGHKESGNKDDQNIDVGTESNDACAGGPGTGRSAMSKDINRNKHSSSDVSNCRLSPELPHGPAYIASDHSHSSPLDLDPGKPKIWSVTDFLGSGQGVLGKDGSLVGEYPKLDFLKTGGGTHHDYNPGGLGGIDPSRHSAAMFGRGSSVASNALSSLSSPSAAHQLHAYQTSLGYSAAAAAGAYPYSASAYGGGKLLRPSVSTAAAAAVAAGGGATSRFSPFPPTRPIGMDPSYPPRREMGLSREGE